MFTRAPGAGPATLREGRAPPASELAAVAGRVAKRMRTWLRRRGLIDERAAEDRSNETPELSPMEACMQASQRIGAVHGAVTTGDAWRFPRLSGDALVVDADTPFLPQIPRSPVVS